MKSRHPSAGASPHSQHPGHHGHHSPAPESIPHRPDTRKHRELRFGSLPPGQAEKAIQLLAGLEGLAVSGGSRPNAVAVSYELADYTFEGLEKALCAEGFHLDSSLYAKLVRALVHFCEETQLRNLRSPERLIKKSSEIYVKAYEHHPHGDHDDTPPDLRDER